MLTRRGFLKGLMALGGLVGIGAKVVDDDLAGVSVAVIKPDGSREEIPGKIEPIDVDAVHRAVLESRHWEQKGNIVPEEGVFYHARCGFCRNRYWKKVGLDGETGCITRDGVMLWRTVFTPDEYVVYDLPEFICDQYSGPANKAYRMVEAL